MDQSSERSHGRLTIGMLTFHRLDGVVSAVTQLLAQIDQLERWSQGKWKGEVLVVDNDPLAGARQKVESVPDSRVRYVVEPEPGISAGRNRALDETVESDIIVFIDDDEEPVGQWLPTLLGTWQRFAADGVSGAVSSTFDGPLDPWVTASRFYERRHRANLATGTVVDRAATNNLLLDRRVVARLGVRFDPAFGLTGGGDTVFTERFTRAGGRLVWCAEAVVTDFVPKKRMTRQYAIRRTFSLSNVTSRAQLSLVEGSSRRIVTRTRATALGAGRVVLGAGRAVVGWCVRSLSWRSTGMLLAARGAGAIAASVGYRYHEYGK